jgi:hypothetical protein
MALARPRLWVTARLQVSAPGQATTSRTSSAPGLAMPASTSRWNSAGSWSSARSRSTKFWRLVTRTSVSNSRTTAASARNCSAVTSPSSHQA